MSGRLVLILSCFYVPGYRAGGPLLSIYNIVNSLNGFFEFRIMTSDRDLGDLIAYPGVAPGLWHDVGHAKVRYLSPAEQRPAVLWRALQESPHDLLYLNSFFSPQFAVFPLVGRRFNRLPQRPVLLAPRGEFSQGAIALKATKKRTYLNIAKLSGLLNGLHWHASSPYEADDIRRELGVDDERIHIASDLSDPPLPALLLGLRDDDPTLHLAFLSRISPKKNLIYALDVLRQVEVPLTFNIYGPAEDAAYWATCQAKIAALPGHIRVGYHGTVEPADVASVMRGNELFFLPTRGETFGHVIAEALSVGTPVLISDQTPWRGLEAQGLGFDLPLAAPQRFVEVIERVAAMSPEERLTQRKSVHAAMLRRARESDDVAANREMFLRVMAAGS